MNPADSIRTLALKEADKRAKLARVRVVLKGLRELRRGMEALRRARML
jgi:hypothetical protein